MGAGEVDLIYPLPLSVGEDDAILCPACRDMYSHIRRVYTRMGSDPHEAVVYEGTVASDTTGSRRSALVVEIDGECGHSWNLVIQQHKGNNYVSTELLPILGRHQQEVMAAMRHQD